MVTSYKDMNNRLPAILSRVGFYLTRVRRASFAELGYRLGQAGTHYRTGRLIRRGHIPCKIPSLNQQNILSLKMPAICGQVEKTDIDRILAGYRFNLNADPDAISRYELELRQRYYPAIRSIAGQVDIRAVWEPARLQHVTVLIAYLRQHPDVLDSARIKEFARDEILWWLTENPFLYGPHYLSVMECGLRLPVLFYGLKVLDNLSSDDAETILKGIFLHAWWIEKNLSLFSSLGNHTVCEALGLVFAGSVYRETETGRRWLQTGITLLEQELHHQVLADGGPAEQAFGYHRFVLDIYWLSADFLESNNLRSCNDFKARLLEGEGFLSSFYDTAGNLPTIGDYDDGHAIAPGLSPYRFNTVVQRPQCRTFNTSGYTIARGKGETLLTFDHGPLGMGPLYNHGHADALSVTLSIGGTHLLVDSGTYRYNGVPSFRSYFKGTRAHNTVIVDGVDQATQATGFVWSEPFTGRLERTVETATGLLIEASHDGYSRLKEPVRHIRSILGDQDGSWLISDLFQGNGQHTFELNFHFHPEVTLAEHGDGWLAERNGHIIKVELANNKFYLHQGEENPPLGWFSPNYGLKISTPVLQFVISGTPREVRFETRITTL